MTQTNKELDDFLAREVMGWKLVDNHTGDKVWQETRDGHSWNPYYPTDWRPSSNIAQAMECAEKSGVEGIDIDCPAKHVKGYYVVRLFYHTKMFSAIDETKERAICLALYEAVKGGE